MPNMPRSRKAAIAFNNNVLAPWRHQLIFTRSGNPKGLLANAITALRDAPAWANILWFDAFHQRTVLRGRAPWMATSVEEAWTGAHDVLTANWLQHEDIHISPDVACQAVEAVAREQRFHPVLDYLARCRWDGEPRLDLWAINFLGAEHTPFVRAASSRWMISAIARVQEPGCKADCALILEGRQGLLKSTALKTLAHPWFTDEIADFGTKDAALQLAGAWIIELPELDSISRTDVSRTKAFMSRTTDRFRPPYGRRPIEQPRQCVFAGTVNENEYLRDETGGRRWWPIACSCIDIDGLGVARDQLWAEARDRYAAGEPWWLDTDELNCSASAEQIARYRADPWQEVIGDHVATLSSVSVGETLEFLGIADKDKTQTHANRVSACLKALGWKRKQFRIGGRQQWRYAPLSPANQD
jgi:predicted P-loop ATPase